MRLSKYATVFKSDSGTPYAYNALSNRLFRLDDVTFTDLGLKDIGAHDRVVQESIEERFPDKLLFAGEAAEQLVLDKRRAIRTAACEDDSHVDLSICPTLHCNFRCNYCFQADQHTTNKMSTETVNNLFRFIDGFKNARTIGLSWYGGEPLVGFSVMRDITERVMKGRLQFLGAGLITNGYLLTPEKIALLEEMKITSVQVTLDGPEKVHDSRRKLASGKPSFQRILGNIDALFSSNFTGSCSIRVNLESDNLDSFDDLQAFLMDRYTGKNVFVYAGRVERLSGLGAISCGSCGQVTPVEWTEHLIKQCGSIPGKSSEQLYPVTHEANLCTATMKNAYVVGPRGELYKCWEDVGKPDYEVGNVNLPVHQQNHSPVEAMYQTAADPYLDEHCRQCNTMPICGGGCANRRLRKIFLKDDKVDFCSLYKDHLVEFLNVVVTKEEQAALCQQLLDDEPTQIGVTEIHVSNPTS